jgi:hypothetical protein
MTRVLIFDDAKKPEFVDTLKNELRTRYDPEADVEHVNPVERLLPEATPQRISDFLKGVRELASQYWDAIVIDLHLAEVPMEASAALELSLQITEEVRHANKAASVILYSGTISEYVKKLLDNGAHREAAVKSLVRSDIYGFVPRNRIDAEVILALDRPSWLLVIDRALMRSAGLPVTPEESEYHGKSLADLAASVRRQSQEGVTLTRHIGDHGVAAFLSLTI